jgi:hypothetical protein
MSGALARRRRQRHDPTSGSRRTEADAADAKIHIEDVLGRARRLPEAGLFLLEPNEIGRGERTARDDLAEEAEAIWLKS